MTRLIYKTYQIWLMLLGPLAFVFAIGPWIDKHFPVVDPFVVVKSEMQGGYAHLEGWFDKRRDCKIVEAYAVIHLPGGVRVADIAFLDRSKPDLITRPTGVQFWGPWQFEIPANAERVTMRTTHRCHPLWDTVSEKLLWQRSE